MRPEQIADILKKIDTANISCANNLEILGKLSVEDREEFARKTGTMVLYMGNEVVDIQKAEEESALAAMPRGFTINQLNGLNIGCGNRLISPYLLPIDIMRQAPECAIGGVHHALTESALLAHPDELPFKENSVDFIVALHTLEHYEDPIEIINYWLDIVKPGGGIGIVVPDWRYTWDSRNDHAPYSHKWNPTPNLIKDMYLDNWSKRCYLEKFDTYRFKLSFDFVLRKHGSFVPFSLYTPNVKSGHQRYKEGIFLGGD